MVAQKKKFIFGRTEKKRLNRFHEYVDVAFCLRRRARAHIRTQRLDLGLGYSAEEEKKKTV